MNIEPVEYVPQNIWLKWWVDHARKHGFTVQLRQVLVEFDWLPPEIWLDATVSHPNWDTSRWGTSLKFCEPTENQLLDKLVHLPISS